MNWKLWKIAFLKLKVMSNLLKNVDENCPWSKILASRNLRILIKDVMGVNYEDFSYVDFPTHANFQHPQKSYFIDYKNEKSLRGRSLIT